MLFQSLWKAGLTAAVAVRVASALAIPETHAVHEKRDAAPRGWIKRDRVAPQAILPVRIGLTQSNLDRAEEFLSDVADPASPNFGKHWTSEEVIEAFRPSEETVRAIKQWLNDAGITRFTHSDNKGWFAFDAPAEKVEALLHAEYHEYEDEVSGGVLPSCDQYHVPKHIQHHIDYITPGLKLLGADKASLKGLRKRAEANAGVSHPRGDRFKTVGKPAGDADDLSTCDEVITPACVKALYKIPEFPEDRYQPCPENKMAIYESLLSQYDQTDLNLFFSNFTPWIHNGTHPQLVSIDGGIAQNNNVTNAGINGGEVLLDLQLSYPIVYPQIIQMWDEDDLHYQRDDNLTSRYGFNQLLDSIDGSYCTYAAYGEKGDLPGYDPSYPDPEPGNEGYNHPLQCGVYKPPYVLSTSYGGQEVDVPIAYQKRQCNEFLKLGLQGTSFMFASGDAGVGQYPEKYGGFDGPTGCLGKTKEAFNPTWPVTCPWITAVGATKLYAPNTVYEAQPESVVFDPDAQIPGLNYSSGGGFSNIYPRPAYQEAAVAQYLSAHNPPYEYYSDLATVSSNVYAIVNVTQLQGKGTGLYNRAGRAYPDVSANGDNIATYIGGVFGTSGGTSASTPIFSSIINRINEERLAAGKSTLGFLNHALYSHPEILNDVTNGTNSGCKSGGFPAAPGWDPSSGLGTPVYPKMLEFFMSLP